MKSLYFSYSFSIYKKQMEENLHICLLVTQIKHLFFLGINDEEH